MDIKLIASDLDGTLLYTDHATITERTLSALSAAHKKGVKIAISTGRTLALIKDVASSLPLVDYIIYSNGAGVYDCRRKETVFVQSVSADKAVRIIELLDKYPVFYNVYANGRIYYKTISDVSVFKKVDLPEKFIRHFIESSVAVDDMREIVLNQPVEQIIVYFAPDECRKEISVLLDDLGGLHSVSSFSDNIEIMSENASKGLAVKAICDIIGCTAENSMTFGDAWNDCSMLEFAEYSFAMANADEKAKKSAKFITDSNAEDGVAKAIEKYILNT